MGSEFTLTRDTRYTGPITTVTTATATTITRMNIGGTAGIGTIIGTITIEIMIGIDAWVFLDHTSVRS